MNGAGKITRSGDFSYVSLTDAQRGLACNELTGLLAHRHWHLRRKWPAESPELSISTRHLPDVHVVTLHGELDIVSAYDFAPALVEVAGSTVVVDLSDLTFIDHTGISALVMARNRMRADGVGELV